MLWEQYDRPNYPFWKSTTHHDWKIHLKLQTRIKLVLKMISQSLKSIVVVAVEIYNKRLISCNWYGVENSCRAYTTCTTTTLKDALIYIFTVHLFLSHSSIQLLNIALSRQITDDIRVKHFKSSTTYQYYR